MQGGREARREEGDAVSGMKALEPAKACESGRTRKKRGRMRKKTDDFDYLVLSGRPTARCKNTTKPWDPGRWTVTQGGLISNALTVPSTVFCRSRRRSSSSLPAVFSVSPFSPPPSPPPLLFFRSFHSLSLAGASPSRPPSLSGAEERDPEPEMKYRPHLSQAGR